ncbi:MAG TPA: DUF3043 domain-containing protein [Micromonosporaceae bacterium]|nr:DUF3043 domain-containing protein [Micromonosporaceae bacterium]
MPSLFRRKPDVADPGETDAAGTAAGTSNGDGAATESSATAESSQQPKRRKGYTPSKRELGVITPKRKPAGRVVEPPPANRREAIRRAREKAREARARERAARAEARAGMLAGKEEYLLPRDKGPERALVRDIVDSRRNAASYFLPGALIVVCGVSAAMPPAVQLASNILWFLLIFGVVVDSVILSRRIKRLVQERFPRTELRMRTLYTYGIMRSLSFRKLRIPAPRVKIGEKV